MKAEKITIHISSLDSLKHTRSAFANMHITGCGGHKSKKDYDRKALRKADRKVFADYK